MARIRLVALWPSIVRKSPTGSLFPERHRDDVWQGDFRWYSVGGNADGDGDLRHVEPERAVQPVPERQAARPVRANFLRHDGVMDTVHPRRNNQAAQPAFGPDRQFDVRVVEEDFDQGGRLPYRQRQRRNANHDDLRRAPRDRQHHFGEVEA